MEFNSLTAGQLAALTKELAAAMFNGGPYIPIFAWGDPGLGKTRAISDAASALGARLVVQHVADREPTEMGGIYWERDGEMVRLKPTDLPTEDGVPTILFFDEVPQAPMMNKNILARIVLDREIAGHRLGNKVYVCAAGNHAHNRAGTSAMPSHLNARLTHIDIVPDPDSWRAWAALNGVHPYVLSYNRLAPNDHHVPDPDKKSGPNPRSWARVSDIEMTGVTGKLREVMILGTLGAEVGERYIQQASLFDGLIDLDEAISDPNNAQIMTDRRLLYVAVSSLAARTTTANFSNIITYLMRIPNSEEYLAVYLSEARARQPSITSTAAFTKFALSPLGRNLI